MNLYWRPQWSWALEGDRAWVLKGRWHRADEGGPEAKKASGLPELTGKAPFPEVREIGPWGEFMEVEESAGVWSKALARGSKMLGKAGKTGCAGRRG